MRARRLVALAVLAVALAAGPAAGRGGAGRGSDSMAAGDAAFATRLESVDGEEVLDLADGDGKPVVLVFGSYT